MRALLLGDARDDRDEVEEAVRDMERDDAVALHVLEIDAERLAGDEVHRDGVARESVDREHVEVLRRLSLEREPRIAQRNLDLRRAVGEEAELLPRELHHARVNVVEAVDVAGPAVRRDGSGAQTDDADADRAALVARFDRDADARGLL